MQNHRLNVVSSFYNLKRNFIQLFSISLLLISMNGFSQTSTETLETESVGASSFTDNGVIFNIISHQGTFDIFSGPNLGWNGTARDNRFIDNTGTATLANANASFSIKTTSNLFKVNRFWVFLANYLLNQNVTGTLTVTGKLSGVTKFTQTKTTGFETSLVISNGYTLIDLTNLNGQNYSNIIIDEIRITLGGDFRYAGLDAFTWVKDNGMVLPVKLTDFKASLSKSGVLKANWKTASETKNSHFILQSSEDGKIWKELVRKDAAPNGTAGATYQVETYIAGFSLAGFGLLSILLLPFSNKRYRILTILAVIGMIAVSCAKSNEITQLDLLNGDKNSDKVIYVRLAQIDLDGTTEYSEILTVKAK